MRSFLFLSVSACLCAGIVSESTAQTKLKGNDVAINGESFFQLSNITSELTKLARADGLIASSESFHEIAVSGAVMSGILNQYKNCNPKPIYMITDGGGNDLMGSCGGTPTPDCAAIKSALNTVKQYFTEMKNSGTKKIIWMRYPDPQGAQWATLTANQNVYNPEVEKICKASIEPKCLWIDMRPVWEGHYAQYTQDGIHPTTAGGTATAAAFWKFAKDSSFFEMASTPILATHAGKTSVLQGSWLSGRDLILALSLNKPSEVKVRVFTLSGETVWKASRWGNGSGVQSLRLPFENPVAGIYRLEVEAEGQRHLASLAVH